MRERKRREEKVDEDNREPVEGGKPAKKSLLWAWRTNTTAASIH